MSLPNDVSRCVGRFGLGPDDPVCPRRDACTRYTQRAEDRERWPEGYPAVVPVATGLCRDGGDYFIGAARVEVVAYGTPAPQGSKSFKGHARNGRAILAESSKKVRPWRQDVKYAALAICEGKPALDGPLRARMVFTVPKPKSAPKRRRTWPDRTPDLSKLIRSTEDALTDAGLWADDARVVEYSRTAKVFPGEDPEALDRPGVRILVESIG